MKALMSEAPDELDVKGFSQPFPSRFERTFLFGAPWAVVLAAGLASQLIREIYDPLFSLVTVILAVSASLVRRWMNGIPAFLTRSHDSCPPEKRDTFRLHARSTYARMMSWKRFIPVGVGIALALAFIESFTGFRHWRSAGGYALSLIAWSWLIGAAGGVAFWVSHLIRTLGTEGCFPVLPEHPDGCGGLKPVGAFFVRMIAPLLLVSAALGIASLNPAFPIDQIKIFRTHQLADLSGDIERALRDAGTFTREEINAYRYGQYLPFSEPQLRWEVGMERIKRLKEECSKLDVAPASEPYSDCISRIMAEAEAAALAYGKAHSKLWNPRVIPFARIGLVILVAAVGLCFIWPLGGVHQAMASFRDASGQAIAEKLKQLNEAALSSALPERQELDAQLEKAREHASRIQHYPVWPFDAAILSTVVVPQVIALGSALGGGLVEWLTR